jgi:hypothetical protein
VWSIYSYTYSDTYSYTYSDTDANTYSNTDAGTDPYPHTDTYTGLYRLCN